MEKVQQYIEQIAAGLTDEAMDELCANGDGDLISDAELGKLFSKKFQHKEDVPHGYDFYLIYDEKAGEMQLYSTVEQLVKWAEKCDINSVQSIIFCATECINHCIREKI